jgi:hypothetical protein
MAKTRTEKYVAKYGDRARDVLRSIAKTGAASRKHKRLVASAKSTPKPQGGN